MERKVNWTPYCSYKLLVFMVIHSILTAVSSETFRNYLDEISCWNELTMISSDAVNIHPHLDLWSCQKGQMRIWMTNSNLTSQCSDDETPCVRANKASCNSRRFQRREDFCGISEQLRYLRCYDDEFRCQITGKCISRMKVRDGVDDCTTENTIDNSDEEKPLPSCDEDSEFRCDDPSQRCIPRDWVLDGIKQCLEGSDEMTSLQCHNKTEFRCSVNGRCIQRNQVNDRFIDCSNATDEHVEHFDCLQETEFDCGVDDRCLPRAWVGNSIYECRSKADEDVELRQVCTEDEFVCLDKSRCLPKKYLCDGNQNCRDGSDEIQLCESPRLFTCISDPAIHIPWSATFVSDSQVWSCPDKSHLDTKRLLGFKCRVQFISAGEILVTKDRKLIPQFYLHNIISVCADKSDQCFGDDGSFKCVRCLEGETIISKAQLCDGFIDCPDLSDECSCEWSKVEPLCERVYPLPPKRQTEAFNLSTICDGRSDYEDEEDEEYCDRDLSLATQLNSDQHSEAKNIANYHQCYEDDCEHHYDHRSSSCDGVVECPLKDDECSVKCQTLILGWHHDDERENDKKKNFFQNCFGDVWLKGHMKACYDFYTYSRTHNIHLQTYHDKLYDCNQEIETICASNDSLCPWKFFCKSTEYRQSIDIKKRCDSKIECKDSSDELSCPNTTHFYCLKGNPLFIAGSKYADGIVDCYDRSDELIDDDFSSSSEMIKNQFLRSLIWVISCISIIANVVVVYLHVKQLSSIKSKHTSTYINTLLVTSLAMSDFLMGFALLIIAVKSQQFSGDYYFYDHEWRSSVMCSAVGALILISSETSVNMLILMTALRLYITFNPFKTNRINFKVWRLLIALSWLASGLLALIPIFVESFTSVYYIDTSPYFRNQRVNQSTLTKYYLKTNLIYDGKQTTEPSFTRQQPLSSNLTSRYPSRTVTIKGHFGFYGSSGVCFPNLYGLTSPQFEVSVIVVLYNMVALVFIVGSYVCIFKRATRDKKLTSTSNMAQMKRVNGINSTLKRRVMFVVLTDMLCWFPILVLTAMSYCGINLSATAHTISAIVVVPINSVINPIIYSGFDEFVEKYVHMTLRRVSCNKKNNDDKELLETRHHRQRKQTVSNLSTSFDPSTAVIG